MNTKIDPREINLETTAVLWIEDHAVYIDRDNLEWLCLYHWHIKQSFHYKYAYREIVLGWKALGIRHVNKTKIVRVWMHREVSGCPKNMVPHHVNYCGLDNRRENLQVMTVKQNHDLHNRSTRPKKFPKARRSLS